LRLPGVIERGALRLRGDVDEPPAALLRRVRRLGPDDVPGEVVRVPPGLDEDDEAGGGEAGDGDVAVPVLDGLPVLDGVRALPVLVRVIDDQHVEGLPGPAALHPEGGEPARVAGEVEPGLGGGVPAEGDPEEVFGQRPGVERRPAPVLHDPVADRGGERGRDLLLVGGDADAEVRVPDEEPEDEGDGDPAALALLRGREDAEAGAVPGLHPFRRRRPAPGRGAGGTGSRR
jgi:hypothetical protein